MAHDCIHRSEDFRLETCATCRGKVDIKVFKCALHGECSIGKQMPGIHLCDQQQPKTSPVKDKPPAVEIAEGTVILNANKDGIGEVVLVAWISEGCKGTDVQLVHFALGGKATILKLLGQTVVTRQRSMVDTFALDKTEPRLDRYRKHLGIKAHPKKPQHNLTEAEIAAGRAISDGKILLCPDIGYRSRMWPIEKWVQLAESLQKDKREFMICSSDPKAPFAAFPECSAKNWRECAAIILSAKQVIASDGASIHLAGTFDIPAIEILTTGASACSHYKSVKSCSPTVDEVFRGLD